MSLSKSPRNTSCVGNPLENVVYFRDRLINNIELFIGCTVSTFKRRSQEAQDKLRRYAELIEETDKKCGQVKRGGAVAKVAGGVVTLGGVVLAPASGGSSLAVAAGAAAAGGALLSAAGHAASSSASHTNSRCKEELREVAKIASGRVVDIIKIFHKILIEYDEVLVQAKEYLNTDHRKALTLEEDAGSRKSPGAIGIDAITKQFGDMVTLFDYIKGHGSAQSITSMPSLFLPTALPNIGSGIWDLADDNVTLDKCNVFAEKLREFANGIEDYTELLLVNYEKCTKMTSNVGPEKDSLPKHNIGQNIDTHEIISYISCQLSKKSKETVIAELQNEMELGVIQEWRESIFRLACRNCEATLGEDGDQYIQARLELRVRRGCSLAARDLGDIVELVSYISGSDGTLPRELLASHPAYGFNGQKDMVPRAPLDTEGSKCFMIGDADSDKKRGDTLSPNTMASDLNVSDMITNLAYQLDNESTEDVVQYLANEIPLVTLKQWREDIFQMACTMHEENLEQSAVLSGNIASVLQLRRGSLTAQDYVEDIVKLVPYVSGPGNCFPYDVLNSQRIRRNPGQEGLPQSNQLLSVHGKSSKGIKMVETREQSDPCPPQCISLDDNDLRRVINRIDCRLCIETTHDVVSYLVREIPLETLQIWGKKLFQACRIYQAKLREIGYPTELIETEVHLKGGSVEDCAIDVVKLVLFILGVEKAFPDQLLWHQWS